MYRVEWLQSALDDLARAWTNADSALRQRITAAANEIDEELQSNAPGAGESRDGLRRIDFVFPLAYTFTVEGSVAVVSHVWLFSRHGGQA